jgi:hypothetical protein
MRPVPITDIFPQPWEVAIAGRVFLIGEARLCDLISLQAFIDKRSRRPMEAFRAEMGRMTEEERGAALWAVYDELDASDRPMWGNDAGNVVFDCDEGLLHIYSVILRREQPDQTHKDYITDAELRLIALRATADEYWAMFRAFRRVDPLEEVVGLLELPDLTDLGEEDGAPVPWPKAIAELVELTGWTLEYIKTLTMSQITAIRTGGAQREYGIRVAPKGGGLKEVVAAVKARYRKWRDALKAKREGRVDG